MCESPRLDRAFDGGGSGSAPARRSLLTDRFQVWTTADSEAEWVVARETGPKTPTDWSGLVRISSLSVAAAATTMTLGALTFAPPADATSASTWARLAHCESGGRWHINTGNGYYGGLQFTLATWRAYGGGRYATYPHQAGKWQQIAVAERVQGHQGWGAWPVCSRRIGVR